MGISQEALCCKQNADCCNNCFSCIFCSLLDFTTMTLKCSKFVIYKYFCHTYICICISFCSFNRIAEVAMKGTQVWSFLWRCTGNKAWYCVHPYSVWLIPNQSSWSPGPLPLKFMSVRTYQKPGTWITVWAHSLFKVSSGKDELSNFHVPGTVQYPLRNDAVTKVTGTEYFITNEATMHPPYLCVSLSSLSSPFLCPVSPWGLRRHLWLCSEPTKVIKE